MAGLISLAAVAQGQAKGCGDEMKSSETMSFALLKTAPKSLKVLLEFTVTTPCMGKEDKCDPIAFYHDHEAPALTPAHTTESCCLVVTRPMRLPLLFLINFAETLELSIPPNHAKPVQNFVLSDAEMNLFHCDTGVNWNSGHHHTR